MNESIDPNVIPDNVAKARAILQVARAAAHPSNQVALDNGALEKALWAAEDLLGEVEEAVAA